jgi:hypothetical protein
MSTHATSAPHGHSIDHAAGGRTRAGRGAVGRLAPSSHDNSPLVPIMGPANYAPGAGIMGGAERFPHFDAMGGSDAGARLDVIGSRDPAPRLDVMGESTLQLVDALFDGRDLRTRVRPP